MDLQETTRSDHSVPSASTRPIQDFSPQTVPKDQSHHAIVYGHGSITGIVSVAAFRKGSAKVWRRVDGRVVPAKIQFKPWALISSARFAKRLNGCEIRSLKGGLHFDKIAEVKDRDAFERSAMAAYNDMARGNVKTLRDVPLVHQPPLAEQFLAASGQTFFKGMTFSDVKRLTFDIESTGLDAAADRVFMISVSTSDGYEVVLHGEDERRLLLDFNNVITEQDPDVIEGYNIFGFDIPFLLTRYKKSGIRVAWGRDRSEPWCYDDSVKVGEESERFVRCTVRGRQVIDILHAVKRYDAVKRVLPNYKLKEVAKHFGFADGDRVYIDGEKIYEEYTKDPDRVARYASADASETRKISGLLTPVSFALAQMVPMPFEKVCTAGPTALVELPMLRAYLRAGHSLPAPQPVAKFEGGHVELCQRGRFPDVIKLDVASMYPSIVIADKIGPHADPLSIFHVLAETWRQMRLDHKSRAKTDPTSGATEGALKIVINGMYGYLAYKRGLFNNPDGAAKVTAEGREIVYRIKTAIIELGGVPIEIDTDGIMCTFPNDKYTPAEFADMVTSRVGRRGITVSAESERPWSVAYVYKAKNYCYLDNGKLKKIGAALKSRGIAPFLRDVLDTCLQALLDGDVGAIRTVYEAVHKQIAQRALTADQICAREKLSQSIESYRANNNSRRPAYEALIAGGVEDAAAGTFSEFYKAEAGYKHLKQFQNDYDIKHYLEKLREKIKVLEAAFSPSDFARVLDISSPLDAEVIALSASIVSPLEIKPWINLAANMKLSKLDPSIPVSRAKFVTVDDEDGLTTFRNKYKNTDIYRTPWAYFAAKKPTNSRSVSIGTAKMLGDFWIELEGSRTNDQVMRDAGRAAIASVGILENQLGIYPEHIRIYFNGGKSFYLRVSYAFFVSEPTVRLCDDYALLMKYLRGHLPDDLQDRVDQTNYDDSQVLRIVGSRYPGGGTMVEIPHDILVTNEWHQRIQEIVAPDDDEIDPFFLPTPPVEVTEKSRGVFKKITEGTRFKDYRVGRKCQKEKNRIIKSHLAASPGKMAPCVAAMAATIAVGGLGFYGRCKLIYEASEAGLSEDEICRIFLAHGDPNRYGVLEPSPNPKPGSCGYRITKKYRASFSSDCGCDKPDLGPFCDPQRCYRGALCLTIVDKKFGDGDPTFDEFQGKARALLKEFLDED